MTTFKCSGCNQERPYPVGVYATVNGKRVCSFECGTKVLGGTR